MSHSIFAAIADPTRRLILEFLNEEAAGRCAGEIASRFDISWPAVSRHLRILRLANLVWETREGRNRVYQVNHQELRSLSAWLAQFRLAPAPGPASATPPGAAVLTVGREAWS